MTYTVTVHFKGETAPFTFTTSYAGAIQLLNADVGQPGFLRSVLENAGDSGYTVNREAVAYIVAKPGG